VIQSDVVNVEHVIQTDIVNVEHVIQTDIVNVEHVIQTDVINIEEIVNVENVILSDIGNIEEIVNVENVIQSDIGNIEEVVNIENVILSDIGNIEEIVNVENVIHSDIVNVEHTIPSDEVVIAILAKNKAYCLPFYLNCIYNLDFDKKKLHLYIRTNDNTDDTIDILKNFIEKYKDEYKSVYYDDTGINTEISTYAEHEWNYVRFKILADIRQNSINYAIEHNCHYFVIDCDNFITKNTLYDLYQDRDKGILSPLLISNTLYANFHYEACENGYYKHHDDYYKVLDHSLSGLIKVDVVHCTYFIDNRFLQYVNYDDNSYRYEYVIFSDKMRQANIPQYIINTNFYGFLVLCTSDNYLTHIEHFKQYLIIDENNIMFN
jgi:hypothetical protein